ncbi:MAG: glycerate kinase [Erysipelotrichaceae bacterium]|nr:glycerate kinase [Erysipelotrichaceae bacterium]MDD3808940.1 glycerate kinase [Erysipelotrichaceae bacterium]
MKKIVIACDSFKESISALDAAKAIERGLKTGAQGEIETVLIPLADGGEGTLEILNSVIDGQVLELEIFNHYNQLISCDYLVKGTMAVVESAKAVGLDLVEPSQRNPLQATSYGLGQLLRHICQSGIEKIIVGLGGSGTNDGGLGMLVGLGAKIYDDEGKELPLAIENILKIRHIDFSGALETVKNVEIVIANDVENPYIGPNGATFVFGPQKGATPQQLDYLETCLIHLNGIIDHELGINLGQVKATGAAGGLGGAFYLLNAKMEKGIELILELTDFKNKIADADYVFTGEGSIDSQTAQGKTISGIAKLTKKNLIPLIALAGRVDFDLEDLYAIGLTAAFSITNQPKTLEAALKDGAAALEFTSKNIARILL